MIRHHYTIRTHDPHSVLSGRLVTVEGLTGLEVTFRRLELYTDPRVAGLDPVHVPDEGQVFPKHAYLPTP